MRRVVNILRPYLGRDALSPAHQRRREVELICVVARFQNFESIAARLSLRDLGDQMSRFYDAVADSIMNADGDLNRFCGAAVVGHFNVLHKVEEARILESAIDAFQHAHKAFDAALEVRKSGLEFAEAWRSPVSSVRLTDITSHRVRAERNLRASPGEEERLDQCLRAVSQSTFRAPQIPAEPSDLHRAVLENRGLNIGVFRRCGGKINFLVIPTCAGGIERLDSHLRRGTSSSRRIKFRPPDATTRIRRKPESIAISI